MAAKRARRGWGEGQIEQLPSGSWRAVYSRSVAGKRKRETKSFPLKSEAIAWLRARTEQGGTQSELTLSEWLDAFMAAKSHDLATTTLTSYRQQLDRVRKRIGSVKLKNLDKNNVTECFLDILRTGGRSNARHAWGAFSSATRLAVERGLLLASPLAKCPVKPGRTREWKAFDESQLARLLAAADAINKTEGILLRLWVEIGARTLEMAGLRIGDWDSERRQITVRRSICGVSGKPKSTKTGKTRTVSVSQATSAMVDAVCAGRPSDDYIFKNNAGRNHTINSIKERLFANALKAAGLRGQGFSSRSMRHTSATLLLSRGLSIRAVSERLGHASPKITLDVYSHVTQRDNDKANDIMNEILGGKISASSPHDCPTSGQPERKNS